MLPPSRRCANGSRRRDAPSFAAYVYDSDFVYMCVGAEREVRGELLFNEDRARRYDVDVSQADVQAGPQRVAEWAREYAPMWAGAGVVDALAQDGGGADSFAQLMRVFSIEVPTGPVV